MFCYYFNFTAPVYCGKQEENDREDLEGEIESSSVSDSGRQRSDSEIIEGK